MSDALAPSPAEFQTMAAAAVEFLTEYFRDLPNRPIWTPTTAQAVRSRFEEPLPRSGQNFEGLMIDVRDAICTFSRHNGHPRFFGYIASPGTATTALSHMIAAAMNVNATSWRSAPAGTVLEHLVIDWMKEILGYPADAGGLLTSGGSMANFAALGAARSAKAVVDVVQEGLGAVGRRMCLYVSEEAHFSVAKAAGMLGLGEANVRSVKTDERLRMDVADLERLIAADEAAGHLPFCVVANAGTTATGSVDPLTSIAAVAKKHDLWLHVDAAYGGFAALSPSVRHLFAGLELADSVTLDPHKWMYLPVGCGCVLYKDPAQARTAFHHGSDYIQTIGFERDEAFAFWDYGPELSRPFPRSRSLDAD